MKAFDQVSEILSELSGVTDIRPTQELRGDLDLDSLQMVTLLMMLEESLGIVLEESDMNPFDLVSVEQVVLLAEKYLGAEADA